MCSSDLANSDAFFTSSQGANTVRVFVGGKQQQSKATNPAVCTTSANTFVWSEDSKRVTIKPSSALVLGSTYSMTVSTFAKDSFGAVSLTKPYVKKFVVQQNSSDTKTLLPGGVVQFANGVIVRAPAGFPVNPVVVTSKNVDPSTLTTPIPEGLEPIAIFNISTPDPIIYTQNNFHFGLPIPSGYEGRKLYVLGIAPGEETLDSNSEGNQWVDVLEEENPDTLRRYVTSSGIFESDIYGIFVKKPVTLNSGTVTGKQLNATAIECKSLNKRPDYELTPCNEALILAAKQGILEQKEVIKSTFNVSQNDILYNNNLLLLGYGDRNCQKSQAFYSATTKNALVGQVIICVDTNGNYIEKSGRPLIGILRHELTHALQFGLIKNYSSVNILDKRTYLRSDSKKSFSAERGWITEGTARLIEESNASNLKVVDYENTKRITKPLFDYDERYKAQDFWYFIGKDRRKNGYSLNGVELDYIKAIFSSGLRGLRSEERRVGKEC